MRSAPRVAPSYPLPAAVVTPAAAGALRALAGLVVGGVAVTLVLLVAVLVSGAHSLALSSASAALLSLGFACASTATIVALADGLRAPALALVFAIATFWTATAAPLWFALPATLVTGLVLTADDRARGGARIGGRLPVAALGAAGAWLLVVGAATAEPVPGPAATARGGAAAALLAPRTARVEHAAKPHGKHAAATRADPAGFVESYYAALGKHRYADAWTRLSPAVKARFGTFAHWSGGYATTLSSTPENLRVTRAADGSATVRHLLVARDRTACGGALEQRFAVTWKLVPVRAGWTAASLSATIAGPAVKVSPCR